MNFSMIKKIRQKIFLYCFLISEFLKLLVLPNYDIDIRLFIIQLAFDYLFLLCSSGLMTTFILRGIETDEKIIIRKIFNYSILIWIEISILLLIALVFYYDVLCFHNGEISFGNHLCISLCCYTTLFSLHNIKIAGEIFCINQKLIIFYKGNYTEIKSFSISELYITIETISNDLIKIRPRKNIRKNEILNFFSNFNIPQNGAL